MDTVKKQIDKWYLKFRQYFFKYSNGFYELPFLVNTPEVMIEGFRKMSVAKYNPEKHLLSSNNPFMKSELIHLELDEDLTLFLSMSIFKKNIKFKFLYDKNIPSNHYFLRYQITRNEKEERSALSNGIPYSTNTWLFYKPGSSPDNYYFKGTSGVFITIYFTTDWFNRYLAKREPEQIKGIEYFLNSSQDYLIYPDKKKDTSYRMFQETIALKPDAGELNIKDFKAATHMVISDFLACLNEGSLTEQFFQLSNNERLKIMQAEKYLRKYLTKDFPGIEHVADKVGIAQTSLKNGFKLVYGKSVYKYYQAEKMQVAAERLTKNPDVKIAKLALEMGYENASKFSAAFKENMGVSPSEYVSNLRMEK